MVGGPVRLLVSSLLGLVFCGAFASAQDFELRGFTWSNGGRVSLNVAQNGKVENLTGDVRDNSTGPAFSKGLIRAEIKNYSSIADGLFMIVLVSNQGAESASLFLLERPSQDTGWILMNTDKRGIATREFDGLKDFYGIVDGFKKISNFNLAQSLRKMVEYFEKFPNKRLQDLYRELETTRETADEFLKRQPRPRITPAANDQGITPGSANGAGARAPEPVYNNDSGRYEEPTVPAPAPKRKKKPAVEAVDPAYAPQPGDDDYEDWAAKERKRLAAERARRRKLQQQQQQLYNPPSGYQPRQPGTYQPRSYDRDYNGTGSGGFYGRDYNGTGGGGGQPIPPRPYW